MKNSEESESYGFGICFCFFVFAHGCDIIAMTLSECLIFAV